MYLVKRVSAWHDKINLRIRISNKWVHKINKNNAIILLRRRYTDIYFFRRTNTKYNKFYKRVMSILRSTNNLQF